MATVANLTAAGDGGNKNNYPTAVVSPGANRLLTLGVDYQRTGTLAPPSVSGLGLTWTLVEDRQYDLSGVSTNQAGLAFYRGRTGAAAPTPSALSIDFGGVTQGGCGWTLDAVDEIDSAAPIVQKGNGAQLNNSTTTDTVTLAPFAKPQNLTYLLAAYQSNELADAGTGLANLGRASHSAPAGGILSAWGVNVTTASASWATASRNGFIAVELNVVQADTTPPEFITEVFGW